jgi:hypothetical protein
MQPSAVSNRTTSTHTAACDGREHLPLSRRPEFRTFRPIINHHSNAAPTDAAVRQRSLCRDDGSAPGKAVPGSIDVRDSVSERSSDEVHAISPEKGREHLDDIIVVLDYEQRPTGKFRKLGSLHGPAWDHSSGPA